MTFIRKLVATLCVVIAVVMIIVAIVSLGIHFFTSAGQMTIMGTGSEALITVSSTSWAATVIGTITLGSWGSILAALAIAAVALAVGYMIAPEETESMVQSVIKAVRSAGSAVGRVAGGVVSGVTEGVSSAVSSSGIIGWVLLGLGVYWVVTSSGEPAASTIVVERPAQQDTQPKGD